MTSKKDRVWVVDDDRSIRWVLERALSQADLDPVSFESGDEVIQRLGSEQPDAIISDVRMPGIDGFALLRHIQAMYPELPVIVMTAFSDLEQAVAAYQGGAFEYLSKPFDIDDAVGIVRRAIKRGESKSIGRSMGIDSAKVAAVSDIIGSAPPMQELFRAIGRLSRSHMTVLVTGESGTGKELVAQALHRHSPRSEEDFIALNTSAIPRDLLESELFGHERGAFTGAAARRIGRFEQAHGGTLFLDEIGDMPADLQTRLLRVLADGEFYRVGGHEPIKVDVRVIAATHQDLTERVKDGSFREDLFHRLNVIKLNVPALRDRKADLAPLADHFLSRVGRELNVDVKVIQPDAQAVLESYDWPGNVRELENVCRWITVMGPATEIHAGDLPPELIATRGEGATDTSGGWQVALRAWAEQMLASGETGILDRATADFERVLIAAALAKTAGRRQDAAKLLGWGRNTLTRKIAELDLDL